MESVVDHHQPLTAPALFLVVLGGRTATSHIELHDVRFVAGASIDATIPELRRQWFGRREGLHLDSVMAVRAIDGWAVSAGTCSWSPIRKG